MRILLIGDARSANLLSWKSGLETYGHAEVAVWSMKHEGTELIRLLSVPQLLFSLNSKIKAFRPDILIGYRYSSYGFIGSMTGFHPFVVAGQGASDVWSKSGFILIREIMARQAFKHADFIHAWAQHMTEAMIKYGAKMENILVLPRGIDRTIFYPPSDVKSLKPINLVITRSLFPEYRHTVVIQALANLKKKGIRLFLNVVGRGPVKKKLQIEARNLGVENEIIWFDGLNSHQVADLIRKSGIYVSMPDTEGLSASLLEAMACGSYPIVSDLPANRELIEDSNNGRLVPVDDVEVLTEAIAEAVINDDHRIKAFHHNLKLIETHGSLDLNIGRFMLEYKRLIDNSKMRKGR